MKRTVSSVLLFILSSCLLFGAMTPRNNDNSILLYGSMSSFSRLTTHPLEALGNGTAGMPFNIKGDDITFRSSSQNDGRRQIATWTLSTNELELIDGVNKILKPKLVIRAYPLQDENLITSIDYYLYLRLDPTNEVQVLKDGQSIDFSSNCLKIDSSDQTATEFEFITTKTAIISNDQPVRLMFHEYSDSQKDNWAYGTYNATVELTLQGR